MRPALLFCLAFIPLCSCATEERQFSKEKSEFKPQEPITPDLWSIEQRQSNANYYFFLAEDRLLADDRKTALSLYELAYSMDPNSLVAAKLIRLKSAEDHQEAFTQAKKMVLLYPKNPELNSLLAQFYLVYGKYKLAEKQFKRVLKIDPKTPTAYIGLIKTYQSKGLEKKAIAMANELTTAVPGFADGWALKAKLYLSQKKSSLAYKAAKMAYDLQSNQLEYIHLYAVTSELMGHSSKAVRLYEVIFRNAENNDDLISRMVGLYKQIGSMEDALALLQERLKDQTSKSIPLRLQLVFIYWELTRYRDAHRVLMQLVAEHPSDARIKYLAALGCEKMDDLQKAIQLYNDIGENSQFYIHAQYRLMLVYRQLKNYQEGINIGAKQVAQKHEQAPEFYLLMAKIESDRKAYSLAISLLEQASQEFPERTDILFLLGVNQEKAGDIDACIKTMRNLIKLDPNHDAAHNYLGYIFAEKGENLEEAEALLKRALSLRPKDGYYMDSLGWVYYKKNNYKKALEFLLKADSLAPNEAVILEHIGDVYLALENRQKAKDYYQKAMGARSEEVDLKRIKKKFHELDIKDS